MLIEQRRAAANKVFAEHGEAEEAAGPWVFLGDDTFVRSVVRDGRQGSFEVEFEPGTAVITRASGDDPGDPDAPDLRFLESMSMTDSMIDHEDGCGICAHQVIMAQVARDLLAAGGGTINEWSDEAHKRWEASKYYQLYQAERAAGRDPNKAFADRGWEM